MIDEKDYADSNEDCYGYGSLVPIHIDLWLVGRHSVK